MPDIKVRGVSVPAFMYGTAWKEERTEHLTSLAIGAGFRAIDTANQRKHYFEAGAGAAISRALGDGTVQREQLFLQTKFTYQRGQDHRLPYDPAAPLRTQVEQSCASSLDHLGTAYVDSYVLHGPEGGRGLTDGDLEVWRAMETLHDDGLARLLGISNLMLDQLEGLHRISRVPIAFVQNRCYASTRWDAEIRTFCREHGIVYQGFSLLTANRALLQRPVIDEIMARTGHTREQLVFAFARAAGMLPLTGTSSEQHMREDLGALEIELEERDVRTIETIAD